MPCKECQNPIIENKELQLCASCNHARRKAERESLKPVKTYKIPKVSPRQKELLKTYSFKRKEFLKKHAYCQVKLIGCTHRSSQVHHAAKRGKELNNENHFIAACENCHNLIERSLSASERRAKGLLI